MCYNNECEYNDKGTVNMKRIYLLICITILSILLVGCTGGTKPAEKPDLEAIKNSEEYSQKLYNEVCFNKYNKRIKFGEPHYDFDSVQCFYINVNDYGVEDITKITLEIFEKQVFEGIPKGSLTKIGERYNVPEYTAKANDKTVIKPFCRINDEDYDYCLSNQWEVRGGISERYALITLLEE